MPGAKLYFYQTNTSTPQPVYEDADLSTAFTQPVEADADGVFPPIYKDPNLPDYRVTLTDADDVIQPGYPIDDISSISTGGSGLLYVRYAEDSSASANAVIVTLSSPSVTAYTPGLMIEVVFANTVTDGTVTVNVNGLGNRSLKHSDGSLLIPGEIRASQTVLMSYRSSSSSFHILSITGSMAIGAGDAVTPAIRAYLSQSSGFFIGADNRFHVSNDGIDEGTIFGWNEGSATVEITGFASPISTSIDYSVSNNMALIRFSNKTLNKTDTSNSTAMTMTGLSTSLFGSKTRYIHTYGIIDNGVTISGVATYQGGTVYFGIGFDGTALFTGSGTKGLEKNWSLLIPI